MLIYNCCETRSDIPAYAQNQSAGTRDAIEDMRMQSTEYSLDQDYDRTPVQSKRAPRKPSFDAFDLGSSSSMIDVETPSSSFMKRKRLFADIDADMESSAEAEQTDECGSPKRTPRQMIATATTGNYPAYLCRAPIRPVIYNKGNGKVQGRALMFSDEDKDTLSLRTYPLLPSAPSLLLVREESTFTLREDRQ